MTRTARRTESALRLAIEAHGVDRVGLQDVIAASKIGGRRLTEDQARAGLARLVTAGIAVRDQLHGMGGGLSVWGIAR